MVASIPIDVVKGQEEDIVLATTRADSPVGLYGVFLKQEVLPTGRRQQLWCLLVGAKIAVSVLSQIAAIAECLETVRKLVLDQPSINPIAARAGCGLCHWVDVIDCQQSRHGQTAACARTSVVGKDLRSDIGSVLTSSFGYSSRNLWTLVLLSLLDSESVSILLAIFPHVTESSLTVVLVPLPGSLRGITRTCLAPCSSPEPVTGAATTVRPALVC